MIASDGRNVFDEASIPVHFANFHLFFVAGTFSTPCSRLAG